ncbi:MAG: hypothetical protein JSR51_07430 [Proteobacteria bacterium]|nr:hypothetical protein [Pseudomonadota bacterium]
MDWLKQFNNDYANAVQAITPIVLAFVSWLYYKLYKESKLNEGDAASIVSSVFWTLGDKFKILAVHKFELSDDISGYKHVSQNSRQDQWQALIQIKKSIFGIRHEIVPLNANDILVVVISRDGKEKWKTVQFNK